MTIRDKVFFILLSLLLSAPTPGEDIHCDGETDGDIDGNLNIATACTLTGVRVDGNVTLFAGGSLIAIESEIDGNIHGDRSDFVEIRNTDVRGNIRLSEMVGDASFLGDSTINGNLTLTNNRSRLEIARNYIENNVLLSENSGGVTIAGNIVDGNLQCKKNNPLPEGGDNSVSGSQKDQCQDLGQAEAPGPSDSGGDADPEPMPPELNLGTGGGGVIGPQTIAILIFFSLLVLLRVPGSAGRQRN